MHSNCHHNPFSACNIRWTITYWGIWFSVSISCNVLLSNLFGLIFKVRNCFLPNSMPLNMICKPPWCFLPSLGVNWPFDWGEEAKNRFSRWWPSWICNWNNFSYFWSTSHPDASYQVSSQLAQGCRRSRLLKQLLTLHEARRMTDIDWPQQLTMSTSCSGELKRNRKFDFFFSARSNFIPLINTKFVFSLNTTFGVHSEIWSYTEKNQTSSIVFYREIKSLWFSVENKWFI